MQQQGQGRFAGKVAVVTGAGRRQGLGEAIARRLASDGAAVVLSDIGRATDATTPDGMIGATSELQAVAAAIAADTGARVETVTCDVRDMAQMRALAAFAVDRLGGLDFWINNAGIGYLMKPLLETEAAEWQAVIDVNLTGCFNGLKAAAEIMVPAGRGGRVVNIASQAAKSGFPFAAAYCSSKHGLVGLVRSAAIELGRYGITVNNVCPNHVTTGLGAWQNEYFSKQLGLTLEQYLDAMKGRIPMGRPGLPQDTANAVAFLCSDEAVYITAESMNVSGGEEPH
ncbi:SDR family NAD(P)-dependent oxidoreductase [Nitrospirillum pindoramense]|uniref:Meso-butanediol dehydrogenase/(S,S)-butanediol dehydrogenase/diacetyl reductase n=1 Tax=Nitrospirillum amazonense TaxID=28077 RepID=A0A560HKK1_9PROT|nr:SDR family NAD(P)-dependent oxidoreductase [Nitrospirillum amazonense]TWB45884.1 meso-butanediol dehydrogenase/(S,S)-butanediol dehydrogenase/diacetyl reductase [Nitrospirillum amazonense]